LLAPLEERLPPVGEAVADDLLDRFLDYVNEKKLTLYQAQEEAILEIFSGKNVILSTPTGSGKSLVATAACFKAMAEGKRAFYTCPIKALVSEKFFSLCVDFHPDNVGMMTGDATVNRDAPIICCTAEILANMALREGEHAEVDYVIMDEFHYYADRERGVAWQIPLLTLPQATFLLMSATMGATELFEQKMTDLSGRPSVTVRSDERPVPLDYIYRETPLHETIQHLIKHGKAPIYIVNFTQRSCAEEAQNLMSNDFCSKEEKKAIHVALEGMRFDSPYGKEVAKFMRHGIGLHHAGLLPKYRLTVEKLAQQGLLKIICGTDTLGVGVNIPIRTVLFTKLCKYDGEKVGILTVRDFRQISGRAGRKGFDIAGSVVVQAPEHVIENLRMDQKASGVPGKKKKVVHKKPPVKGYVHWDKSTFERLTTAPPEPLVSRFSVTHAMLLNVLARPAGGCAAMKRLVRRSHDTAGQKRIHKRQGFALFRSLVEAKIVEFVPREDGGPVRVNADLQRDFSLNQTLSLYLLDTIKLLDMQDELYAHDLLTLLESIMENPDIILMRQLDKLKTIKMAELKASGVEFDERIAELEKMEYPKPHKEFIYDTFNAFTKIHPWVGQENIRPKSIAREMYESYMSFPEYIKEYDMQRAEGVLLRYLSDVYKAFVQTVPYWAKTRETEEIEVFLSAIVRGIDSSLLDEWERMRNPDYKPGRPGDKPVEPEAPDITRDERAFTVLVRNLVFQIVRALSMLDYATAADLLHESDEPWTAESLEQAMAGFYAEHNYVRTDPKARVPANTIIEPTDDGGRWLVNQVLCDREDLNDWVLECEIDMARSRAAQRPVITLRRIGS
jgi:superfamily II RNA helicase